MTHDEQNIREMENLLFFRTRPSTGLQIEKVNYRSKALGLSITKLKADYDSDSPIESYATLKKKDRLDGRNRLALNGTS